MEAGRAVQRGLVTPDRTTLHRLDQPRLFAMTEKIAMADGRVDAAGAAGGLPRRRASRLMRLRHGAAGRGDRQRDSARCCSARWPARARCRSRAWHSRRRSSAAGSASTAASRRSAPGSRRPRRAMRQCRAPLRRRHRRAATLMAEAEAMPSRRAIVAAGDRTAAGLSGRRLRARLPGAARAASRRSSSATATAPAACWPKPRASLRSAWPTRTRSAWPS